MHNQTILRWLDLTCGYKNEESPRVYLIAAAVAYMLLMAWYWTPILIKNENVYLIHSHTLAINGFVGPDGSTPWLNLSFMFNLLLAPLWWFTPDPIKVALAARAIIWLPVVYSIARLARELRVPPLFFIGGFLVWLIAYAQSLGAGEWVLASIEGKVCAYGLAFAALTDLMCNRVRRAAFFAGAAVLFHILVGGWFLIGLGIAMLADRRRFPFSQLVTFGLIAGVVITPMALPAFKHETKTVSLAETTAITNFDIEDFENDRAIVKFRNPHHLDPDKILNWKVVLRAAFIVVALIGCFYMTQRGRAATLLIGFTSFLTSLWIIAFIAGKAQWYGLLKYYLFRVGDTALPLLFWLCVPAWTFNTLLRQDAATLAQKLIALAVWTAAMCSIIFSFPDYAKTQIFQNIENWRHPVDGELHAAYDWIQQYTEENDIFLINPCHFNHAFKLYTNRSVVVNFKAAPHGRRNVVWFDKLQATNGGRPFQGVGFEVCDEINENFPNLNGSDLHSIRERYLARYYFVDVERPLLKPMLVFQKGQWHIYDLAQMPSF